MNGVPLPPEDNNDDSDADSDADGALAGDDAAAAAAVAPAADQGGGRLLASHLLQPAMHGGSSGGRYTKDPLSTDSTQPCGRQNGLIALLCVVDTKVDTASLRNICRTNESGDFEICLIGFDHWQSQ